jgi:hypothetical protein
MKKAELQKIIKEMIAETLLEFDTNADDNKVFGSIETSIDKMFDNIEDDILMPMEVYINEHFNMEELKDKLDRNDLKKVAFAIRFFHETANKLEAVKQDLKQLKKVEMILGKIKSKINMSV